MATSNPTTFLHGATHEITTSGTSTQTSIAVGEQTRQVRIATTADAHVVRGKNPTATTSDAIFFASSVEYMDIKPGEKVAAIQNSAAGVVYVTELTK